MTIIGFEWNQQDDLVNYLSLIQNKFLILSGNEYKKYDAINGWHTISTTVPSVEQWFTDGMDSIPTIDHTKINELSNSFEVVIWTDEVAENNKRDLSFNASPSSKLIHTVSTQSLLGDMSSIVTSDLSMGDSNVRYLFSPDNNQWKAWNTSLLSFENVSPQNYSTLGNIIEELSQVDYSKWKDNKINLGVYLEDSPNDSNISNVGKLGINQMLSNQTSSLSNINFYILNTTARIDLDLSGLSLTGNLSDKDLTRVQYKVTLNEQPFYPTNGQFTSLSESPQNISIAMKTSDIKMFDWNTLRVDFRDFFGTEDYWQTTFVGNYSSLMFKDVDGNYYSDDVGGILQYLDFGTIIAGEVTVEHEIILKNQYGYAVKDIEIVPNTSYLPEGVLVEMSKSNDPFIPETNLFYSDGIEHDEELSFFVRMNTDVNSSPNEFNKFDVFVKASRKDV